MIFFSEKVHFSLSIASFNSSVTTCILSRKFKFEFKFSPVFCTKLTGQFVLCGAHLSTLSFCWKRFVKRIICLHFEAFANVHQSHLPLLCFISNKNTWITHYNIGSKHLQVVKRCQIKLIPPKNISRKPYHYYNDRLIDTNFLSLVFLFFLQIFFSGFCKRSAVKICFFLTLSKMSLVFLLMAVWANICQIFLLMIIRKKFSFVAGIIVCHLKLFVCNKFFASVLQCHLTWDVPFPRPSLDFIQVANWELRHLFNIILSILHFW